MEKINGVVAIVTATSGLTFIFSSSSRKKSGGLINMNFTDTSLTHNTMITTKCNSGREGNDITRITPHCVVGQCNAASVAQGWIKENRDCSSNYVIGKVGELLLVVHEKDRSWCSSSRDNDNKAITIECASDTFEPYAMNDAVYQTLKNLCIDICKRYGKKKIVWIPDKTTALNYKVKSDELQFTVHRWFANKSCPGDWLFSRLGKLADEVTAELNKTDTLYKIQLGAFSNKTNAENYLKSVQKVFPDAFITTVKK